MGEETERTDPGGLSVKVTGATLVYRDRVLFQDLGFELAGGGWTCLLGTSGVGKTSLVRLIAGLMPGGARIVAGDGGPLAGRLAYMAQQDLLLPWLGVLDNVLLGARLRREPTGAEAVGRARALLEHVGLGDHLAALPAALSGGMRQRAALVRTLIEDRPVVLMDEPFSAVDAITRLRLQDLAAELLRGRTVLLVTHDPLEALRLGHRVHVMAGQPATIGPAIKPPGSPPRPVTAPPLLELQAELLRRLTA
jgi:putative hydroxymethylpyrimidine transport system ATP-binding protein